MEKANAHKGDARYGWEAATEQMQNWQQWGKKSHHSHNYLQLSDVVGSEENVIWWVDTIEELVNATNYFSSAEVELVGMDCEWKPNFVKGADPNQVSILQIATRKKVLIIDLIGLFEREPNALDTCLKVVFHSPKILKLGYSFHHDLKQLSESYEALECFYFCDGVLDLQELHITSKGGLSGLAKTVLGSELNKGRRMSNWEQRPLTSSQLRYAALDAAVLISIFDVCCESSSRESAGTQHTSDWPSLVKQYGTYEKHKRNPEVLSEADLAGASIGDEFADNRDFRRNSSTIGPAGGCWNCGGDHYRNKCPNKPDTTTKPPTRICATVNRREGPARGCWTCGGDHHKNECPENPNRTTKARARINTAADNQASPIELQSTFLGQPISVFSDLRPIDSFVSPNVLIRCNVNYKNLR
ncbi:uncharacterized protein LOC131038409 isoform X1 [Cryptomeria japonica]|uniref:uncharacterized protein LOC131038409 isoform X1 n=1 Tax=Cryptomeria japonica TaxID=3369 RepID=UPI0025ACD0B0|nr:uncharacterized protein LOC131038409 isoform X1 [Cryptomeria japonica]